MAISFVPRRQPRRFVVPAVLVIAGLLTTAAFAKNWGEWGEPVSVGSAINTANFAEGCPSLSPDGLELWFSATRVGPIPDFDIYVARRAGKDQPFGPPQRLGAPISLPGAQDGCPTLRPGGRLYWVTTAVGNGDILMSRRDPAGNWGPPVGLDGVNRNGSTEESPAFFEDEMGREVVIFSSTRSGRSRLYQYVEGDEEPTLLEIGGAPDPAINSDWRPGVTKDGLELYFDSVREGPGHHIYVATRSSTSQPFGPATRLPFAELIGPGTFAQKGFDARPTPSWDRDELVFASYRASATSNDIYIVRRTQRTGKR